MADLSAKARLKSLGKKIEDLLPEQVGAFLFVEYSDSMPPTQLWRNENKAFSLSGDGKRLLGVCAKRQRSVLIHNAEKEILLKGIRVRTFASALCVPILGDDKSFLGSLLVLSEQTDAFEKEHRFALERLSRELAPSLLQARKLPEQKKGEEENSLPFFLSKDALVVLACLLAFLSLWLAAPNPVAKETAPLAQVEAPRDEVVETSEEFLQRLQAGGYKEAWSSLAPELKRRWSVLEFERDWRDWSETADYGEVLQKRKISKVQRHLDRGQVTLLESDLRGDKGAWDWKMQKLDGEWLFTSLSGPVPSPELSKKS